MVRLIGGTRTLCTYSRTYILDAFWASCMEVGLYMRYSYSFGMTLRYARHGSEYQSYCLHVQRLFLRRKVKRCLVWFGVGVRITRAEVLVAYVHAFADFGSTCTVLLWNYPPLFTILDLRVWMTGNRCHITW